MNKMTSSPSLADRRIPDGQDFLSRDEVARLDAPELVRRIKKLQPLIASRAAEGEKLRRPTDEVWSALRASGIFYMLMPKRFGGMEVDFDAFIDVGMAIAEADASTAWNATFCIEHNWILSYWPIKAQEEIWSGGDKLPYLIASYTANPPGTAVPVDGGYRVSAHWKWASGCMHADWVMGIALVARDGGDPLPLSVLVPASQVQVLDTWFMSGMAGTGSNDVAFNDVFVPEHRTARDIFRGGRAVQRVHTNPMYSVPLLPFLGMSAAIPVVGATRSMVNMYQERVKSQLRTFSTAVSMEKPLTQNRLARANLTVRAAELMVRDAARRMMVWATLPEQEQLAERLAIRAQLSQAVTMCRDTAMMIVEGAGTTAHVAGNPFNRAMRDVITISTHLVFEFDTSMEQHGRALVGLEPNSLLI
jgi:alkylation response protein AidB-like acyl-CoA dehydrogenase